MYVLFGQGLQTLMSIKFFLLLIVNNFCMGKKFIQFYLSLRNDHEFCYSNI